ncbi:MULTISPECIES: JAB domain-containing protein [unclassified Oceanispirochaeta]|uniref:JAB domain-containing protein n=1 Tax=unclassified Oceanispirochaeta TaxID=2635722 RepID=UPI001E5A8816|nr:MULTISPECIES: JAB domain-containing protein [unclassified Oceanispirochaeta]
MRCPIQNTRITHPESIYNLLSHMADRRQECFFTISLNGAHEHIKTRQMSRRLVNRTIVHPREVFAPSSLSEQCLKFLPYGKKLGQSLRGFIYLDFPIK